MEGQCTTLSYEGLELCGTHSLCNHNDELILALRSRIRELEEQASINHHDLQITIPEWKDMVKDLEEENIRLREAVEWACENMTRMESEDVEPFLADFRKRAGMEEG